ncbi:MAG: 30S ribosomal protein S6 [Candidatus Babeliales bacterium]
MIKYETLILATPEITKDESSALETQYERAVKDNKGALVSFERWGKYRLAYPIRNNDYGVYFLSRFQAEGADVNAIMKELDSLFKLKLPHVVMRFMNSNLGSKTFTYQKPESLEDIPTQDVDTFLRENKMEGLIKPGSSRADKAAAVQENDFESDED